MEHREYADGSRPRPALVEARVAAFRAKAGRELMERRDRALKRGLRPAPWNERERGLVVDAIAAELAEAKRHRPA